MDSSYVVQKYLKSPALWDGHKYDFRIYVLVLSVVEPLTLFLYKDGLVRLASEKYQGTKNTNDPYVHLTNYSLNKKNTHFDNDLHKLRLSDVLKGVLSQAPLKRGQASVTRSADDIWADIDAIVTKTVLTV